MSAKSSTLVWRRYHHDGTRCPSAKKDPRPAHFASAGEKLKTLGPCGCEPNCASYYQADSIDPDPQPAAPTPPVGDEPPPNGDLVA